MPNSRPTRDCWFSNTSDSPGQTSHQALCDLHEVLAESIPENLDYSVLESKIPGHLVVLEFFSESDNGSKMSEHVKKILAHGNSPTVLCIGNRVPPEQIVDWMREGIFAYAEHNSPAGRIEKLIEEALEQSSTVGARFEQFQTLNSYWSHLTLPERSVLEMILEGIPNKTIATKLGVSQRTIEARRQKLYQKMNCKSLPGVVRSIFELRHLKCEFGELKITSKLEESSKVGRSNSADSIPYNEPIAIEQMVANFPSSTYSDVSNIS